MPDNSWLGDIQGITTVLDENDDPVQQRQVIKFEGQTAEDDGEKTVVRPVAQVVASDTLANLYIALRAAGIIA
jgi:hypothetical protein